MAVEVWEMYQLLITPVPSLGEQVDLIDVSVPISSSLVMMLRSAFRLVFCLTVARVSISLFVSTTA